MVSWLAWRRYRFEIVSFSRSKRWWIYSCRHAYWRSWTWEVSLTSTLKSSGVSWLTTTRCRSYGFRYPDFVASRTIDWIRRPSSWSWRRGSIVCVSWPLVPWPSQWSPMMSSARLLAGERIDVTLLAVSRYPRWPSSSCWTTSHSHPRCCWTWQSCSRTWRCCTWSVCGWRASSERCPSSASRSHTART